MDVGDLVDVSGKAEEEAGAAHLVLTPPSPYTPAVLTSRGA